MLKNNAGYDLKQLFIGSEGTLGVVTRAVLRLWPKLPSKVTALCALRGFDEAVALLHVLQARLGGSLSAFEAMWAGYFHYVLEHMPALRSPFEERHAIYALVEIEGTEHAAVRRLQRRVFLLRMPDRLPRAHIESEAERRYDLGRPERQRF